MKLNECATVKKYIPYSSHIHQHVVRSLRAILTAPGIDWNAVRLRVLTSRSEFGPTSYTG